MNRRRLWFAGVSTSGSSAIGYSLGGVPLRIQAELVPVDLPLGTPSEAYRELLADLEDDEAAGAVVTTHKVAFFERVVTVCINRPLDRVRHPRTIEDSRPTRLIR